MISESMGASLLAPESIDQFMDRLAASRRSALLLDYDGTLAPFQVDRRRATPYMGVVPTLQTIISSGKTRVVIVTGREASQVLPLLGIDPHPEVWGAHGLQRLHPSGLCETAPIDEARLAALEAARARIETVQVQTEVKPGGVAVHWRGLPEVEAEVIRERVLREWFPIAQRSSLKILEFEGGVEIRVSDIDKGAALRTILHELGDSAPIAYLGDDATDERAFEALGDRGLSVLVRPEWRKSAAQVWLRPPDELLNFLTRWSVASTSEVNEDKCFRARRES